MSGRRQRDRGAAAKRHRGMRVAGHKGLTPEQQTAITAVALFVVFHIECERFDRTVCTGQLAADGSGVMPRNATETGIVVAHAAQLGDVLLARAARLGVPRSVLQGAESFVQRMPYAQVEADYTRALGVIGGPLDA